MRTKELIINDKEKDTINIGDIGEYFNGIIIVLNDDLPAGFIIYSEEKEEWQYCDEIACTSSSSYHDYKLIDLIRSIKYDYSKTVFEVISFES